MQYIVSGSQMKKMDEYTIEQIKIPAMVLMEKAAMAVSNKMLKKINSKDSILALVGTGNNGADGVAIARILKEKGFSVDIYILGEEDRGSFEFKQQVTIARNLGVNIINNAKICEYTIIIDAIFGIGLNKPVEGAIADVIQTVNQQDNTVYSVDVPSGISVEDGSVLGTAVIADYTITFGYNKIGLVLYPAYDYVGELTVADIGFPKMALSKVKPSTFIYEESDLSKLPKRPNRSNKGTFGRVLVIAGCKNMSGACYLSAKAAYRMGTGLVKILTVEENREVLQTTLPEAILATYNPQNLKNKIEFDRIIAEMEWATAIVFGPGIGISTASEYLLDLVLSKAKVPVILDADGINMLATKKEYVSDQGGEYRNLELPDNVIVTPHLKEMSRLLGCTTDTVRNHLMKITNGVTKEKNFVLALKDARTIVSNGSSTYINMSGNQGMATGGAGDVLTGMIAALIATGVPTYEATCLGVYIHGLAGDMAKEKKGTYSLMASDIIEAIADVLRNRP